jgi:uncharacterized protein (TIRG00374 family)
VEIGWAPRASGARIRTAAFQATVGLVVGAVLVMAFLRLVNVGAVYQRLQHLNDTSALLCGVAFLSAYVVRGLRWRYLLRPCRVSVRRAVAIYQVAIFLNWLLPIRGGEIAMSLLLRRSDGIPVSRSLAAVFMDKAMDLMPVVVLLAVLPFAPLRLSDPLWVLLLCAFAVAVFGAGVLALAAWRRQRALALLIRPVQILLPKGAHERIESFIVLFVDTLLALLRQPRVLLIAAVYTAAALCLDALFCLLAFRAVGVAVPLPVVLYGYTFFNLAFILPTPPGQVGSNELIGLLIFSGSFGISRSGVGAMFLFSHPWTALLLTCTGLGCLSAMGLTIRSTLRLARDQDNGKSPGDRTGDPGSGRSLTSDDGARNGSGGFPRQPRHGATAGSRRAATGADPDGGESGFPVRVLGRGLRGRHRRPHRDDGGAAGGESRPSLRRPDGPMGPEARVPADERGRA